MPCKRGFTAGERQDAGQVRRFEAALQRGRRWGGGQQVAAVLLQSLTGLFAISGQAFRVINLGMNNGVDHWGLLWLNDGSVALAECAKKF